MIETFQEAVSSLISGHKHNQTGLRVTLMYKKLLTVGAVNGASWRCKILIEARHGAMLLGIG